jgi:hypothetical protein
MNKERLLGIRVSLTAGCSNGLALGGKLLRPLNGREFLKDPVLLGGYSLRGSFRDTSSIAVIINGGLV